MRLPGRRESCRKLAFADAVAIATRRLRATKHGIVRIDLRIRGSHTRASVGVGRQGAGAPAAPAVLAAGDSMMVGIDDFLADELGTAAQVTKDARPGTGISKPPADWENIAAAEVKTVRPRTTVILLGASDGFPMRTPAGVTAPCCDEPWVAEYARRVRAMMQTYLQGGRGRVFWLTLPLSRAPSHRQVVVAVNTAIARAGEGVAGVTVVRFDKLFTPNGYTDVFRYRGRNVRIRDVDGLHFNIQGQAIAANVVAQLIRASG